MMLTTAQLAEKYPLPGQDSVRAWNLRLKRWRDEGVLKERRDWKFLLVGSLTPSRAYDELRVLKVICTRKDCYFSHLILDNYPEMLTEVRAALEANSPVG